MTEKEMNELQKFLELDLNNLPFVNQVGDFEFTILENPNGAFPLVQIRNVNTNKGRIFEVENPEGEPDRNIIFATVKSVYDHYKKESE